MSKSQLHDFAATPDKGLPERIGRKYYGDGKLSDAFDKAGEKGHSLHASLHVAADQKIPPGKVKAAAHSDNPHLRHMAQAAINMNRRYYAQGDVGSQLGQFPDSGGGDSSTVPIAPLSSLTGIPAPVRSVLSATNALAAGPPGIGSTGTDPVSLLLEKANAPWWAGPALAVGGAVLPALRERWMGLPVEWNPASEPSTTLKATVTGITPDGNLELSDAAGGRFVRPAEKVRMAAGDQEGGIGPDDLLAAVNRLEPVRGVPVSTLRLRAEFPGISKDEFDRAALELRAQQRAFLSQHADAINLQHYHPDELNILIHDPRESADATKVSGKTKGGTYYVGVAAR